MTSQDASSGGSSPSADSANSPAELPEKKLSAKGLRRAQKKAEKRARQAAAAAAAAAPDGGEQETPAVEEPVGETTASETAVVSEPDPATAEKAPVAAETASAPAEEVPAAPETPAAEADEAAVQHPPAEEPVEESEPEDVAAVEAEPEEEPRPVRPYPRVIAVANQKGGVGKTTSTINLGACMAELGHRTLIVDLDPQANASTGLGIDPRSLELSLYDVILREVPLEDCIEPTAVKNLFLAPSSLDLAGAEIELVPQFSREHRLRNAIESVSDDFDYVFIDCPPSLGLLTINALTAAKEVCVPIQCEYYALEGLGQLIRNVELVNSSLNPDLDISTIILVMYDGRTKLAGQVVDEVRGHFGNRVCKRVIPRSVRLSEAPSYGQPITTFDTSSKGAAAYRDVAKEIDGVV